MASLSEASGFTNGAVGGDKGWAAAFFRLAVETAAASEDGEKMKKRKPTERNAASTSVMGFVRRIDLAMAILNECGKRPGTRKFLRSSPITRLTTPSARISSESNSISSKHAVHQRLESA